MSAVNSFLLALAPVLVQDPAARPASVAELYLPGEESVWIVEQGGRRLGHCASRYEGEVALGPLRAHRFREQALMQTATHGGVILQRHTLELWTDARGLPLRFDFRVEVGAVRSGVTATVVDGKAEARVRQGPSEQTLSLDCPAGAYLLASNFVSGLELVLAFAPELEAGASHTLFSASALRTFSFGWKSAGTSAEGATILDDTLGERLHVTPEFRIERVEIPAQGIVFRRADERVEPIAIELPDRVRAADLEYEDVRIVDGDVSLAGTLSRPKGAEGRLPGAFFLSGSGLQDRDGFASGLDIGTHEILDRVTRAGFTVLRVDDRGAGQSTGPLENLTFDDLVADGRRALRFLLARADVDPARVALIGHSEGGMSGPILAAEEPVAALVLLAAPGRPLEQLLTEQLVFARELGGARPEELAAFRGEVEAFVGKVAKGEPIEASGLAPELSGFLPSRAWLASHVGRDPLASFARVRCPVLVVQGGRDVQVSAERDTPKIEAALNASGSKDREVRVFPELDHLFMRAGERPSELDYLKKRPVDPEFLEALAAWLVARRGSSGGAVPASGPR